MTIAEEFLGHISEKPWGDYTSADYSIEQWHNACLIHLHDGAPTSKNQCKLPVKTPNGALNRNGVHAAAAALAGARGGVHASSDQKSKAASALVRFYSQLNENPPSSLAKHSNLNFDEFLEHHGVKGMRWGVRKAGPSVTTSKTKKEPPKTSSDYRKTQELRARGKARALSNKQLKTVNERLSMEKKYKELNPGSIKKGHSYVKEALLVAGTATAAWALLNKTPLGRQMEAAGKAFIKSKGTVTVSAAEKALSAQRMVF